MYIIYKSYRVLHMHQILNWSLNQTDTLLWYSDHDTLDTITGCSKFTVVLSVNQTMYPILFPSGMSIVMLYKQIKSLNDGKRHMVDYENKLHISMHEQEVICALQNDNQAYKYTVNQQTWAIFVKQLELLVIVILENENEKRERGARCC